MIRPMATITSSSLTPAVGRTSFYLPQLCRRHLHIHAHRPPSFPQQPHRSTPTRNQHLLRQQQVQQLQHRNQCSNITAAPQPGSGPLMQRRGDRALPPLNPPNRWLRTAPLFLLLMLGSTLAIFNYQKQSSSVVTSTLYSLRTNPTAREVLGDEIYFAHKIPWIAGELNQLHGRIDISFWVKGTRGRAKMRFRSERKERMGQFTTLEWSLQPEHGEPISLLDPRTADPFAHAPVGSIAAPA